MPMRLLQSSLKNASVCKLTPLHTPQHFPTTLNSPWTYLRNRPIAPKQACRATRHNVNTSVQHVKVHLSFVGVGKC